MQDALLDMAGYCPSYLHLIFFGANLTALTKKGGGIHLIAVGNTPHCFAAKIVANSKSHKADHVQPIWID